MLIFQKDTLTFTYVQKSHLKTSIMVKNQTDQFAYYKFKITQPKYYLLKPDKGIIKARQSITIDITLHKDGVPTAANDKIKCFYSFHDIPITQQPQNFQRRSDTKTHKLIINVEGIPESMRVEYQNDGKSQGASVYRSQVPLGSGRNDKPFGSRQQTLTLQKQIEQKQQQIIRIKNQMSTIKTTLLKNTISQKPEPASALIIWAVLGLLIGGIGGFFVF